jgi:hypothetical protein
LRTLFFAGRINLLTLDNPQESGRLSGDPAKPCAKVFAKTLQETDIVTTIHMAPAGILLHLIKQGD